MKEFLLNLWAKTKQFGLSIFEWLVFKQPTLGRIILTVATLLSFWLMLGWKLAIISMITIIVHESGHVLALDLLNISNKGFFPVPFFGGITVYNAEETKSYSNNFIVAIFGPVIGAAFGGVCVLGYAITHWNWLGAIAGGMVVLNLFNMIPVTMLDGGKMYDSIVSGMSPKLQKISYSAMSAAILALGLVVWSTNVLVAIILILCALVQFFTRILNPPVSSFEPIESPIHVSLCVIAYLVAILAMLALCLPLTAVDFMSAFR